MPDISHKIETLRGELIAHRVFGADHWGRGALRVRAGARHRDVTVVGKLLGVNVGDHISVEGYWTDHQRFGRQFKVRRCEAAELVGAEGAAKWMASRLPDIGEGRARALVERFGDALWETIEQHPERLLEVDGINAKRLKAITEAYARHRAERDAMVKLRGWGLTDHQVGQCVNAWKRLDRVVEQLRDDPYQLSRFVHGFGFLRADAVARKMGVLPDAPSRIRAGVEHTLHEASSAGHCYLAGKAVVNMAAKLLEVPADSIGPQILEAVKLGQVVRRGWRVYPSKLDTAEADCAAALRRLLEGKERAA